jgi:hypothetical protein
MTLTTNATIIHQAFIKTLTYVFLGAFVFVVHSILDMQYQHYCRTNLFNIVLFGSSGLCRFLHGILQKTESLTFLFIGSIKDVVIASKPMIHSFCMS